MDHTITHYQNCIKHVLSAYQQNTPDGVSVELVFDDERQHYLAIRVGWLKQKSVYLCLAHLDICDDMIVIQANNTEDEIDEELVELGIPRENICLGVLPPEVRADLSQRTQER
ncbi:MAG: XisI protein [Candidatus Vecturithrix sp.]|jgi:hypothetical protein|nr:XisI protein [Candidatus Vecturithrix sp.]